MRSSRITWVGPESNHRSLQSEAGDETQRRRAEGRAETGADTGVMHYKPRNTEELSWQP